MLHVADAGGDDQRLPQRMGMPGRAGGGFEGHRATADAGRGIPLEQAINPNRAGEVFRSALDGGLGAGVGDADLVGGLGAGFPGHER
ncbi:hypothetical protein D9M71_470420 [compost metagenome]